MKKLLFLTTICLVLTACSLNTDNQEEELYVLTTEDQDVYTNILETELQNLGWSYDPAEIRFGAGFFPDETDESLERIKEVSSKMSYSTDNVESGERVATAAVTIFHPNGDLGGSARFYFKNNLIACGYYTYNDKIYSLDTKGVFLSEPKFTAYENTETEVPDYVSTDLTVDFDGFSDISPNSGMTAVAEGGRLAFYTLRANAFENSKSYSYSDFTASPIDAAFDENGSCAVLAGDITEGGTVSKKLVLLDNLLNPTSAGFDLYDGGFSQVLYKNGNILLANKTSVSEFDAATRANTANHHLFHFINGMTSCDINGNGTTIYALTDSTNVYIYSDDFTLLWRTYYSEGEIDKYMYFADMNGDGTKELYTTDKLNRKTVKYILTGDGFAIAPTPDETAIFLPGDFDCDSRSEFIALAPDGDRLLKLS